MSAHVHGLLAHVCPCVRPPGQTCAKRPNTWAGEREGLGEGLQGEGLAGEREGLGEGLQGEGLPREGEGLGEDFALKRGGDVLEVSA